MNLFSYVILSWIAADFVAGFFHWWEDQYAVVDWPIIGKLVAGPNALHHRDQTAFLAGNYWQRNWTTIVPTAVVGIPVTYCVHEAWLAFAFLSQANELHSWGHRKCNRVVTALQEAGIVCSPRHHAKHHRDPFSERYCVMSNWLNPLLDLIKFWRMLEMLVFWVLRVRSRSWLQLARKDK